MPTTVTPTPLKIGSLLPTTGSLAFLGPPTTAGVNLGIAEINAAGGVLGKPVQIVHQDSGDTKSDVATQSASSLLGQGVSAIIGAVSAGVSKAVINQITGAGVIQLSPAATSPEFTTWDDKGLFWRTAPSDVLQGNVLGNYIATSGAKTLGMIVLNDDYGTGMQNAVKASFEAAGGAVIAEELFNEGESQFSVQVERVVAAKPDAVALITFVEVKSIIPALLAQGIKPTQLYMVDLNMANYSHDFDAGTLKGAQGTIPGSLTGEEFKKELLAIDPELTDFSYSGESYDAVNLISLAAEAAMSTKGTHIAAKLKEISEAGEKCGDFPSCVSLLRAGKNIDYDGESGPVTFSVAGDPSEAYIGVYKYLDDNTFRPIKQELGRLSEGDKIRGWADALGEI